MRLWKSLFDPSCWKKVFPSRSTKIFTAVDKGELAKVKALLRRDPNLVFSHYSVYRSVGNEDIPLHWAAGKGNQGKEMVELLLAYGSDVNAKGDVGWTPLHRAVGRDGKDVAELLLTKGADVNAEDAFGETPLHMAAELGPTEVVALLLAKGADVNAKNEKGETPLHLAVRKNRRDVVKLLLANKADVNATTRKYQETPLRMAVEEDDKELVQLLLANKADVNAKDTFGRTPLYYAKQEVSKLLQGIGGRGDFPDDADFSNFTLEEVRRLKAAVETRNVESAADALTAIHQRCFIVNWGLEGGTRCLCGGLTHVERGTFVCKGCGRSSVPKDHNQAGCHRLVVTIGHKLNRLGGLPLMQGVGHKFVALSGNSGRLSSCWNGIGQWRE